MCAKFLYCKFSKFHMDQNLMQVRLLMAAGSPSYNNNKNSTYLQFPLRLPHMQQPPLSPSQFLQVSNRLDMPVRQISLARSLSL